MLIFLQVHSRWNLQEKYQSVFKHSGKSKTKIWARTTSSKLILAKLHDKTMREPQMYIWNQKQCGTTISKPSLKLKLNKVLHAPVYQIVADEHIYTCRKYLKQGSSRMYGSNILLNLLSKYYLITTKKKEFPTYCWMITTFHVSCRNWDGPKVIYIISLNPERQGAQKFFFLA